MKALVEKYKARQTRKETKDFEEWKKTHSKSTVKTGLLMSFVWIATFTLLRVLDKYYRNELYSLDNFKEDFIAILITSLLGGVFVAWSMNRKFQKKLKEERDSIQNHDS